jgi:uncharacterized oxidoreductase
MVQAFIPHLKNKPNALIVNVSSGLAFVPFPLSPIYSAAKAGMHAFTRCLRVQLKGSSVTVVELAPPGVETKLFRGEFEKEMRGQKGMPVEILVTKAITGIEAGKKEVRPGLSNILYLLSRLAPALPFGQMARWCAMRIDGGRIGSDRSGCTWGITTTRFPVPIKPI